MALASQLNVKNTAVSNWESGANSIDIEMLYRICKVLKISVNDIYGKFSLAERILLISDSSPEASLIRIYQELSEKGREYVLLSAQMAERAEQNK